MSYGQHGGFTCGDIADAAKIYVEGVRNPKKAISLKEAASMVPCSWVHFRRYLLDKGLPVRVRGRPEGGEL